VGEQLLLAVEPRADVLVGRGLGVLEPEAGRAVAAGAVRLVDVVAALYGRDQLLIDLGLEARLGQPERCSQLVEPVADDECGDADREEADPARARRLADDLGAALGRGPSVDLTAGP
jgi:hypothetical protein